MILFLKNLVIAALLAGSLQGLQTDEAAMFRVRPEDSSVKFSISKWTVFTVEGRFSDFSGNISYEEDSPEELSVTFEVDVRSIDTGNRTRNKRVMGEDFFAASTFPRMMFESSKVLMREDGNLDVLGDLTIKGVTREIAIVVTPLGVNHVPDFGTLTGFQTSFQLDRTDFDVTGHRWSGGKNILGHTVDVTVLVSARMK